MPSILEDTTIEDILKTVADLHERKDYQGALKYLDGHRGNVPADIWHFNMGTLYAGLEKWPQARFHFLMSDKHGFPGALSMNNKAMVEEKLNVSKLEKPITLSDYFYKAGLIGEKGVFTTVSLLFLFFGIIALWRKKSFKIFWTSLVLASIVLLISWWVKTWNRQIALQGIPVYEGPSLIFDARNEIPPGIMMVTTDNGPWHKVLFPSRFRGWVKNTDLKEIK
jgi:hypothetical protein